jgi:hypothetical protein
VNLKWKFIYLGRRPSPSPLLIPDVLADVDVVDLKLSISIKKKQIPKNNVILKFKIWIQDLFQSHHTSRERKDYQPKLE